MYIGCPLKQAARDVKQLPPPQSSAEVKESLELYSHPADHILL